MKKYLTLFAVLGTLVLAGCHCQKEKTINFAFDSYDLTMEDKAELNKIADQMMKNKSSKVEIYGYTDAVGTKDYNMGLSRQRAASAASYLEGKGIAKDRIMMGAFGKADPVATNKTVEGRMENRRVEITYHNK